MLLTITLNFEHNTIFHTFWEAELCDKMHGHAQFSVITDSFSRVMSVQILTEEKLSLQMSTKHAIVERNNITC